MSQQRDLTVEAAVNIYPDALKEYVERSGSLRTQSSLESFTTIIRQLHSKVGVPVERVTLAQLTDFCLSKRLDGLPSAPASIRLKRTVMNSFFGWLEFAGIVKSNPASQLKFTVKPGHGNAKQGHWLSESDVATIVRGCPNTEVGRRDRLIVMIGFFTGLRLAEIAGLRWQMFDHGFTSVKVLGKGNKWATIGLPPQVTDVLKAWRLEAPSNDVILPAMHATNAWGKDGRSALNWVRPLHDSGVSYAVRMAGDRVGITVRPHDMRRTYAGLLEGKGVAIKDISRAMRHGNVGTTDRYLDANPARAGVVTTAFSLNLGES